MGHDGPVGLVRVARWQPERCQSCLGERIGGDAFGDLDFYEMGSACRVDLPARPGQPRLRESPGVCAPGLLASPRCPLTVAGEAQAPLRLPRRIVRRPVIGLGFLVTGRKLIPGYACVPSIDLTRGCVRISQNYDDIEVIHYSDDDIREGNQRMLDDVGCTWEQLKEQATAGCFESEEARHVWLVISSFEPVPA